MRTALAAPILVCMNTTTTQTGSSITIALSTATTPATTRVKWDAVRGSVRANLTVGQALHPINGHTINGFTVSWSANRGQGWTKRLARKFATEAEATLFGAIKASQLVTWIEKQPAASSRGADITMVAA